MAFTEQDLDNLSALARITILPEEKEKMLADMQAILGYVSEINDMTIQTERIQEDVRNVMRDDVVTHATGSNTEAILENAPKVNNDYVEVVQVLK